MKRREKRPGAAAMASAISALALLGASRGAHADDGGFEPITPYRPTVSNPAQLPAAGQLELELGGLRQRSGDARRASVPYVLKLGFDKEWGVLLGGESRVWTSDPDGNLRGLGDTSVVLKRAWAIDEASAFGAEFGVKLPTANDRIGSGKSDQSINAIYSRDLGPVHMDVNVNALRLGAFDAGTSRVQFGASNAYATALSAHWAVSGEVSGDRHRGADSSLQFLTALTWSPSKLLTIDFGIARATRPAPATTSLFTGAVFPLAKLF